MEGGAGAKKGRFTPKAPVPKPPAATQDVAPPHPEPPSSVPAAQESQSHNARTNTEGGGRGRGHRAGRGGDPGGGGASGGRGRGRFVAPVGASFFTGSSATTAPPPKQRKASKASKASSSVAAAALPSGTAAGAQSSGNAATVMWAALGVEHVVPAADLEGITGKGKRKGKAVEPEFLGDDEESEEEDEDDEEGGDNNDDDYDENEDNDENGADVRGRNAAAKAEVWPPVGLGRREWQEWEPVTLPLGPRTSTARQALDAAPLLSASHDATDLEQEEATTLVVLQLPSHLELPTRRQYSSSSSSGASGSGSTASSAQTKGGRLASSSSGSSSSSSSNVRPGVFGRLRLHASGRLVLVRLSDGAEFEVSAGVAPSFAQFACGVRTAPALAPAAPSNRSAGQPTLSNHRGGAKSALFDVAQAAFKVALEGGTIKGGGRSGKAKAGAAGAGAAISEDRRAVALAAARAAAAAAGADESTLASIGTLLSGTEDRELQATTGAGMRSAKSSAPAQQTGDLYLLGRVTRKWVLTPEFDIGDCAAATYAKGPQNAEAKSAAQAARARRGGEETIVGNVEDEAMAADMSGSVYHGHQYDD